MAKCLLVAYYSSEAFVSNARDCDEAMVDRELNLVDYVEMVAKEEIII